MPTQSYARGHLIIFDAKNNQWIYDDNKKPIDHRRPCKHCGRPPTPEGYDACIGYIPGATSVCCGHGREESKIMR